MPKPKTPEAHNAAPAQTKATDTGASDEAQSQPAETTGETSIADAGAPAGENPPVSPRLLGMSRWLAITVLSVVLAIVLVVTSTLVAASVQRNEEVRAQAVAEYEAGFEAYDASVKELRSAVSNAAREVLGTNVNQLSDAGLLDKLNSSLADARAVLSDEGAVSQLDLQGTSNEALEEEVVALQKLKRAVDNLASSLAKDTTSLVRNKDEKRQADEEARIAAELAKKKASAASVAYETLFRAGDTLLGTYYRFEGKIIQDAGGGTYRVNMTKDPGYTRIFWEDTILLNVMGATPQRLLEDDIISFTAFSAGIMSYETIFGATVELPAVIADGSDVAVTGRDS